MGNIYLLNTLGGKKEVFKPITEGQVKMYNCGPTVHNFQHIGNFRAVIFIDTLRRMFEFNGYTVKQIINITDIGHLSSDSDEGEDKMTNALKREGKPQTKEAMRQLANYYFEKYKADLIKLNIELPEHFPFASDHVEEYVDLIKKLQEKGLIYKITDGVYFDTQKLENYGKLGGIGTESEDRSRVGANSEKKSRRDFALWKSNEELGYPSPWGNGFPGWHIECSAMAIKYLGETLDIHTGGIEHIPIHHNNEIAQSESVTGKPFANYWLHNDHLRVDSAKMAKSVGNVFYVQDLIDKGYDPIAFRYLMLSAHYRIPMNFTFEALDNATRSLEKLVSELAKMPKDGVIDQNYLNKFTEFINDDLGITKALSVVYEILKSEIRDENKLATILKFDEVLGLNLVRYIEQIQEQKNIEIPIMIQNLATERELARKNQKFERADQLRAEIAELGFIVEDADSGPKISKK